MTRVAFYGERNRFLLRTPDGGGDWAETAFFDSEDGLREFEPDVLFVFDAHRRTPPAGLGAVTVGWLPGGLHRTGDGWVDPGELGFLGELDAGAYDRLVSSDPLLVRAAAPAIRIWRSCVLPVADSLFVDEVDPADAPRPLFIGDVELHRAWVIDHGFYRQQLTRLQPDAAPELLRYYLAASAVGLNVHYRTAPTFEDRIPLHLAAGHLLISGPLEPAHGLTRDVDYLQADNDPEFEIEVWRYQSFPQAFAEIRRRGRAKAELFRASRVYPRLVADVLRDVAVFGRGRG